MTINFNVAPYFDDYDENKNFHRILFKPGVAVQARELTQLQTILQKQIERFGRNIFKEGAMVIPGQASVDVKAYYVKVGAIVNASSLSSLVGTLIWGGTSGVVAKIIATADSADVDPNTMIVKYMDSGSSSGTTTAFTPGETLYYNNARSTSITTVNAGADAVGRSSIASIESGVYFVGGNFVLVTPQTVILEKYNNTPSYRIGLFVDEQLTTAVDDTSLVDNAIGSYNYAAPGADRYTIVLTLIKVAPDSVLDQNFIELIRVDNGNILSQVNRTEYSILEKTLARRTYDQSGDFTVRPFQIEQREYRNNNRGTWASGGTTYAINDIVTYTGNTYTCISAHTSGATTPPAATSQWIADLNPPYNRGVHTVTATDGELGEAANLAIGLEPGKAYIRGFEIEKIATEYLKIPKSRANISVSADQIQTQVGNYIYITNLCNYINTTSFVTVSLYDKLTVTRGSASGTLVGTAKARYLQYSSGTPGQTSCVYKLSLFDVQMNTGKTFEKNVKQIYIASTSTTADVVATNLNTLRGTISTTANVVTGVGTNFLTALSVGDYIVAASNTIPMRVNAINSDLSANVDLGTVVTGSSFGTITAPFNDVGYQTLLFKLPQKAIRSTANYTVRLMQRYAAVPAGGVATIGPAVASGGGTTAGSTFETTNPTDYIAIDTITGNVATISGVTLIGATANLAGFSTTNQHMVFARVIKTTGSATLSAKAKVLTIASKTFTATQAAAITLSLGKADVYKIDSITCAACPGVDFTSQYTLDDGQRPTHYAVSTITRKQGYSAPSDTITVNFRYFQHQNTGDYFSVESYSGIRYEDIPVYKYAGENIKLSDAIDFRPRIDDTGTDFVSTGSSISALPARDESTQLDYSYYLPRRDKIAIDASGNFFDLQGVPALQPQDPPDPDAAMVLYKLELSPYTLDEKDMVVSYIDNKRYTMRDIGILEKRITNIEYYTSLSLLEQETKTFTILDSNGLDRFKSGFIVDNFTGHGVGDVTQPDYLCSIDMEQNLLRPFFRMDNFNLIYSNLNNVRVTGELATLPYSNVSLITQPYASTTENVNPYNVFKFIGDLKLYPEVDEWFEVNRRPDLIVNVEGNFDSVVATLQSQGVLGTIWNSWQTQWTGTPVSQGSTTQTQTQAGGWPSRDVTTTTLAQQVGQSRSGINTSVVAKVDTRVVGDRILSSAAIPYIRARAVAFVAKGLKPYTQFYPYFDGVNVQAYIQPATKITFTTNVASSFDVVTNAGTYAEESARQDSNLKPQVAFNRGDKITYGTGNVAICIHKDLSSIYVVNVSGSFTPGTTVTGSISGATGNIASVSTAAIGDNLVSTALGDVAGVYYIPNSDSVRFRTGTRELKLTSSATNVDTYASLGRAKYTASGIVETKQATVESVRNAKIVTTQVNQNQTVTQTLQQTTYSDWYDPLAQTFLVQQDGGAFLTQVDLFFRSKDSTTNIPVRIEIREVVNGYPGKTILPFSQVVMPAASVNISEDATAATTFVFPSPVYVQNGVEYALVVLSDSNDYNIWVAKMGQTTVTGDRTISQQPYLGSLFKSQNASTWTASQTEDLKFTIYRASFSPLSGTMSFYNENLGTVALPANPFYTSNTSSTIKVLHPNHGFKAGSNVTFYNALGLNTSNIPLANVNKTLTVSNVFVDYYTVDGGNIASVTGFNGGSNVIATTNMAFDAIQPIVQFMDFQQTYLNFYIRTTDYTAGTLDASPGNAVIPNDTNYMSVPKVVLSSDNDGGTGLNKSFRMDAYFVSTADNLSPVIDLNRLSVITIKNKVNNPTTSTYNIGGVVDTRTIVSANTKIAFANSVIYSTNANVQTLLATVNPGRQIIITGSPNANVIVSGVDRTTGNITVLNYNFGTVAAGNAITIVSKDGYVDEIAPTGGSTLSKYMTRQINLSQPATFLKVIFAASIPPGTYVDMYYKILPAGSYSKMSDISYVLATPNSAVVNTSDQHSFTDVAYDISGLTAFSSAVIKLVFRADVSASSLVPLVQDLRVIACA